MSVKEMESKPSVADLRLYLRFGELRVTVESASVNVRLKGGTLELSFHGVELPGEYYRFADSSVILRRSGKSGTSKVKASISLLGSGLEFERDWSNEEDVITITYVPTNKWLIDGKNGWLGQVLGEQSLCHLRSLENSLQITARLTVSKKDLELSDWAPWLMQDVTGPRKKVLSALICREILQEGCGVIAEGKVEHEW